MACSATLTKYDRFAPRPYSHAGHGLPSDSYCTIKYKERVLSVIQFDIENERQMGVDTWVLPAFERMLHPFASSSCVEIRLCLNSGTCRIAEMVTKLSVSVVMSVMSLIESADSKETKKGHLIPVA